MTITFDEKVKKEILDTGGEIANFDESYAADFGFSQIYKEDYRFFYKSGWG